MTEDGIEEAFEVLGEVSESVKTGLWVGDCFIYTNSVNRLNYYVGGEIVTVSHLDRSLFGMQRGLSSEILIVLFRILLIKPVLWWIRFQIPPFPI